LLDPDILIDNHVSDGADYQHTMTLLTTQYDKLGKNLGGWLKNNFEPQLYKGMAEKKWDMIPYVNFETTDFGKGMEMFYDPPRYSSGYAALFQTIGFVPETHMLKPFKDRGLWIQQKILPLHLKATNRHLNQAMPPACKECITTEQDPLPGK
jgi:hypothetical protein